MAVVNLKEIAEKVLYKCLNEQRKVKEILNNNYVYLTDDNQKPYMVKFMKGAERKRLETEIAMFNFVGSNTDIYTPEIVDFGECEYGIYMVREIIVGESLEQYLNTTPGNLQNIEQLFNQAGQALAKCHLNEFKEKGLLNSDLTVKEYNLFSKGEFNGFIEKLHNNNVISPKEYSALKEVDVDYYFSNCSNVFCHSDYNPKNILVRDENVISIIDFEWACSAPPWDDLATFHLFAELGGYDDKIDSFYEGYRSIKSIDEFYFVNLTFYKLYRLVTMLSFQVGASDGRFEGESQQRMFKLLREMLLGIVQFEKIVN